MAGAATDFAGVAALAGGHAEARAIQVALKLGLFEVLRDHERNGADLAVALGTEARATTLLANALVALRLLSLTGKQYALTALARDYLLESSPYYFGGMILFDGALWDAWGRLEETIRTGKPARTPDMFQSKPEETARFIRAMDSVVRARGDAVWTAEHLELGFARTIVDLGGGPGTYLLEFLRRWPKARGVIYDLPATLTVAREILAAHDAALTERIELREVDYNRDQLPGPVDVIFMSNIIHSEDERTNAALFARCFDALTPGGMIIVKDHIMDDALVEPAAGALFAIYLMLVTPGRDYSLTEVSRWLHAAQFINVVIQTLPSPPFTSSIVSARKL